MTEFVQQSRGEVVADGKYKINKGRWSRREQMLFEEGLKKYGKEWRVISELIKTRTVIQIRTHAQKYFQKLAKTLGGPVMSTSKKEKLLDNYVAMSQHGQEELERFPEDSNFSPPPARVSRKRTYASREPDSPEIALMKLKTRNIKPRFTEMKQGYRTRVRGGSESSELAGSSASGDEGSVRNYTQNRRQSKVRFNENIPMLDLSGVKYKSMELPAGAITPRALEAAGILVDMLQQ
eukprot:snap_masked-scaffold_1-processed-gene-7.17-mRNA-1 protein AED:0.34 eAED:0.77 QI:0/-1/0/1/-1/1/1/0/235